MAQQIFDQYVPLAKVSASETIPVVAAIAQTRDGKDELLLGNVPFVPGPGGLYVPVSASNRLPVEATLSGRNVQPTVRTITTTPLAAGTGFTAPTLDLEQAPGVGLVSYIVECDTPTRIDFAAGDGTNFRVISSVVIEPTSMSRVIPRFPPQGRRWRVILQNPTATDQTTLRVYELQYADSAAMPQILRAMLAYQLPIRDTAVHNPSTDPGYVFRLVRIPFGGGKASIYINNTLNQQVNVTIFLSVFNVMSAALGTINVPAASRRVITNQDFPGLDVPSEEISLSFRCDTAPTTGTVSAYIDTLVGGSA